MPQIGEIRKAKEISRSGWHKYIWHACPNCGKTRWVQLRGDKPWYENCLACNIKQGSLKRLTYYQCRGTVQNPVEGDIRRAYELVGTSAFSEHPQYAKKQYIWRVCPDCRTGKWVRIASNIERNIRCHKCATTRINKLLGKNKPNHRVLPSGYVLIKLAPDHPFLCMTHHQRYIFEHRLIMAQHLGRPPLKSRSVQNSKYDRYRGI